VGIMLLFCRRKPVSRCYPRCEVYGCCHRFSNCNMKMKSASITYIENIMALNLEKIQRLIKIFSYQDIVTAFVILMNSVRKECPFFL